MKRTTFILFIIIGLFGFSQNLTQKEKFLKERIQGNWKTEYIKGAWKEIVLIFTFQDSTCTFLFPFREYPKYWIKGDTLNIAKRESHRMNKAVIYQFLIDKINSENLSLKPINKETKDLLKLYTKQDFDEVKLTKIKKRFDWKIKRIGFYSSICFGACPSMYLEIDSLGNLYFEGKYSTEKEGLYSGKLSTKEFETILSDINCIEFDSLKKMYSAGWTDDQTCGIKIKTNDKIYEISVYGYDKEPIELRILFHRLMELYKNIKLKKDTTIEEKFQFKDFDYSGYPPPPPPPPIEEKD